MPKYEEDVVLDCSGLNCPYPVLKTKAAIDTLNLGQVLKVISTDPGSVNDIAAWGRRTGNELLNTIAEDNIYTFYLKKRSPDGTKS